MKRYLFLAALAASTFTSFSQTLNDNELGVLFSRDDYYGTARYEAMGGAFGALGSDVSSVSINPAGGAVAKKSKVSISLANDNFNLQGAYYGGNSNFEDNRLNINQAGAIFVFEPSLKSDWNRFAFSFNYKKRLDFNSSYDLSGNNNNFLYATNHVNDLTDSEGNYLNVFDATLDQEVISDTYGESSEFTLGFSSVHNNKLFLGLSLNFKDILFEQKASLYEMNDDVDGNILDATFFDETYLEASGFSLGLGFIYKIDKALRVGLSYETPTWYPEVLKYSYEELYTAEVPELNLTEGAEVINDIEQLYSIRTPSRFVASGAYIFGKQGLISVDYTYKDYTSSKVGADSFSEENVSFQRDYRATQALALGTEWRFDNMSVRGGYYYEKNPNLVLGGNTNKDNIKGYSLGLGYSFGNTKFDLSYREREYTEFNHIYSSGDLTVDNKRSRITGTLTFNL